MIFCFFIMMTMLIVAFHSNKFDFAFSVVYSKSTTRNKIDLKGIFSSIILNIAPIVAGAGKLIGGLVKGGAAKGGAKGAMGGGGGGQGGGLLSKATNMPAQGTQAVVSGITSLIQGIKAKKLKDKADAAMPALVDAGQAAYLSELQQKRRSIDTGADFAVGMQQADATNAGTNEALVRASGGDAAGTIQALLQSERVTGDTKNQVLAQGQQQQMQYNSMYGDLLNNMAGRRMNLQLMRSQQARAEWAKMQSNASRNFMGMVGNAPLMKGNTPSVGSGVSVPTGGMPAATPSSTPVAATPAVEAPASRSGAEVANRVLGGSGGQAPAAASAIGGILKK